MIDAAKPGRRTRMLQGMIANVTCHVRLSAIIGFLILLTSNSLLYASLDLVGARGRFFTVGLWIGTQSNHSDYLAYWLRIHRSIKERPGLAKRLDETPVERPYSGWELGKNPGELGLSQAEINRQPTHIYTVQIAIYANLRGVRWFGRHYWAGKAVSKENFYKNLPAELKLYSGGEFSVKEDPLYMIRERVNGIKRVHVRYGLYENRADAERARRALQNHFGFELQVLRRPLTEHLVRSVWWVWQQEALMESAKLKEGSENH